VKRCASATENESVNTRLGKGHSEGPVSFLRYYPFLDRLIFFAHGKAEGV